MGNTTSRKISAQDKAILDLKTQRDKLHQYQKRITVITARETAIARELLAAHDRPRALLALRRKKFQESLLARTDAQLAQLEQLAADVEFAAVQAAVVYGLQQGTRVLKEMQREMGGVEGVERLLGENAEAVAYQREVTEMLNQRMSSQEEEEVEDELEALEAEMAAARLPVAPREEALPDVPVGQEEVAQAVETRAQKAEPMLA